MRIKPSAVAVLIAGVFVAALLLKIGPSAQEKLIAELARAAYDAYVSQ